MFFAKPFISLHENYVWLHGWIILELLRSFITIIFTLTLLDSRRCKITAGVSFLALYILFLVIWSLGTLCIFPIWGIEGPPMFFFFFFFTFDPFP